MASKVSSKSKSTEYLRFTLFFSICPSQAFALQKHGAGLHIHHSAARLDHLICFPSLLFLMLGLHRLLQEPVEPGGR